MPNREQLQSLLGRVETATGPDWQLATDINDALDIASYITDDGDATASIDSALALVERVLPGVFWLVCKGKTRHAEPPFGAQLLFGSDQVLGEGEASTAPLAILRALLSALISESQPKQETQSTEEGT